MAAVTRPMDSAMLSGKGHYTRAKFGWLPGGEVSVWVCSHGWISMTTRSPVIVGHDAKGSQ
jgi:hypothetical protein